MREVNLPLVLRAGSQVIGLLLLDLRKKLLDRLAFFESMRVPRQNLHHLFFECLFAGRMSVRALLWLMRCPHCGCQRPHGVLCGVGPEDWGCRLHYK